jgi:predicted nucleic acid-binding protein
VIVLDASVVLHLLVGQEDAPRLADRLHRDQSVHAPALLDLEVTQTLRRLCAQHELPEVEGRQAVENLEDLAMRRYPHTPLLSRIWQLRGNLSAYDATYVALAESLGAPLLTRDRRLAGTRGHRARIELV